MHAKTGGGEYSYIFLYGDVPLNRVGQCIIFVRIGSTAGSIFVIFVICHLCRPFALRECDFIRLNSNISTFSDRFLTNSRAGHNFV